MATDEPPTTSTTPATPTDAPFPFDSPHADVILQSCDGVNFRVRKAILAEASPVFDSMFTLPSGQSAEANDNNSQDLPIVPVTEDSTALTGLLHLCYPADRRLRERTFDELCTLLEAARKYAMDRTERYIMQKLRGLVEKSPLPVRVYCIAIRYRMDEDLIRAAARSFLDESIHIAHTHIDSAAELYHIRASAYIRLLDYRRRCADAVQSVVSRHVVADSIAGNTRCWCSCITAVGSRACSPTTLLLSGLRIRNWFHDFMKRCESLVKDQPSGKDIMSQGTVMKALVDASKCSHCGERAQADLEAYLPSLMASINNEISQVSLEIDY